MTIGCVDLPRTARVSNVQQFGTMCRKERAMNIVHELTPIGVREEKDSLSVHKSQPDHFLRDHGTGVDDQVVTGPSDICHCAQAQVENKLQSRVPPIIPRALIESSLKTRISA